MSTSIKFKFIPSKIKGKAGVICLQLIHNRKIKLIRTRFRIFPAEWDSYRETIFFVNSGIERQIHLQSVKTGMEAELIQLYELILLLEQKGEYTIDELIDLYISNSFNGYLFPFIYTIQNKDNLSQLRNHNKRLKRISEILGLEKSLSSYVSRHSWATIALRKGVSIEVISEGMGHENGTTTRIYLASLGQSVVDKANAKIIKLE